MALEGCQDDRTRTASGTNGMGHARDGRGFEVGNRKAETNGER